MRSGRFRLSCWTIAVVCILALLLGIVAVVDRSTMLELSPKRQSVSVLIGVEDHARFTLSNGHPWNDAKIEYVKAQCGCFRVGEKPSEVPAGASREITLSILIDPMGDRTHNALIVKPAGRDRLEVEITAEPVLPFEGWPEYAQGTPDTQSGTTRIVLDPAYRGRILSAQAYSAEGDALETILDPDSSEVFVLGAGEGTTLSLMFQTADGDRAWTGTVMDASAMERAP